MASERSILFMGTPGFAVGSLEALINADIGVSCVVTAPDRPAGRGRKIRESEVSRFCTLNNLPVLKPTNLKDPKFLSGIREINPDIIVVVAFRMLPEVVWSLPPLGSINLHASLLPQYRGAAPINHAIINGESYSGVTTFLITKDIDTGTILGRKKIMINPGETAGTLHERLMKAGASLLVDTVKSRLTGQGGDGYPQEKYAGEFKILRPAPKIHTADCFIDWDHDCATIDNLIRGLSPYPSARTMIKSGDTTLLLKIISSEYKIIRDTTSTGEITSSADAFRIKTSDGYIYPTLVQLEGKSRMTCAEFTRGFDISSFKAITHQA